MPQDSTVVETQIVDSPPTQIVHKPLVTLSRPIIGGNESALADWFLAVASSWEKMPEELKDAVLLMQRRFTGTGGSFYYLTPPQALAVVRFCRAKNLEVHSDHWFFDPANERINISTSGLRAESRSKQIDLGPPQLERLKRPWPAVAPRIVGYETGEDFGYLCKMRVGTGSDVATYEAWFSTSAQVKKPDSRFPDKPRELKGFWATNPDHMLQVAAQRNCIKNAMGSGISQMPSDDD